MHDVIVRQKYGVSIYYYNRYMNIFIIKCGKTQLYINTVSLLIDGFMVTYSNTSASLLLLLQFTCTYMYNHHQN